MLCLRSHTQLPGRGTQAHLAMVLGALLIGSVACFSAGAGSDGADAGLDAGLDAGPTGSCTLPLDSSKVTLPADDGQHHEPTEWWYWTGHLQDEAGTWYGFEYAFFLQDSAQGLGKMVHHALTDLGDQSFHHTAGLSLGAPTGTPGHFDFSVDAGGATQTASGGSGHDQLHGEVDGYSLELSLESQKRPVLQHGDGYTDYSFGGYTYYYSRPRMAVTGTLLRPDGSRHTVTGQGWFDHQWGPLQDAINLGWDWFALQLDDQRELMIFIIHDKTGQLSVGASLTDADCNSRELATNEFSISSKRSWTSPHGKNASYPLGWTLQVLGETFEVDPVLDDQEVDAMFFRYWEGAAVVSGDATGRAYIELTGY